MKGDKNMTTEHKGRLRGLYIINKNKAFKTYIPLIIAFIMAFSIVPWENIQVHGFDPDKYYVDSVTLFKIYDRNRNPEQIRVLVTGGYLKDAEVGIVTSTGYQQFKSRTVNSDGLLQFDIAANQVGQQLRVGSINIDLNEALMPTLTGITRKVKLGAEDLSIQGTNLTNINAINNITAAYEHKGAKTPITSDKFDNDSSVRFIPISGSLGLQHLIFEKTEKKDYNFPSLPNKEVKVNITYTYQDQFSFIKDIEVDDLTMRPNRGERGDTVYFEAPFTTDITKKNLQEYDVFFLKEIDGTDLYTNTKKGTERKFQQNVDGKSVLTVKLPSGLAIGEYYVVLTNVVSTGKDPMEEINQEKIIGKIDGGKLVPEMFTVIDASIKSKIINVQPNQGPDTGSKTTISGQFIGTLNIPEFTPNDTKINRITLPTEVNPIELKLSYGTESGGVVGWYNKGKTNEEKIKSAVRTVKVLIGSSATFLTRKEGGNDVFDVSFDKDLDRIVVKTPQVADAEENPKKDVVIETTTILTTADNRIIEIKERAQYKDKYTFIPSKVTPTITSVIPDKIQVLGSLSNYEIPEDRMIAIHGTNFMIHRYVSQDGVEVIRYPIIEIGNELGLNKNTTTSPGEPASNPNIQITVLDATGRELDGTEGNEIGTKILVTIPAGKTITNLGKTYIKVTNPMRNSETSGLSAERSDFIEFVNPDSSKNPIITSVVPDAVSTEGGEDVVITGTNFDNDVKVFIDGQEIKPITRRGDGKEIKFKAPKGREGETQLQVMNPEGGMDTRPFTFVKTFTNPKITDFSPKKGNTGTLVIIKGDNFLKPEPTAPEDSILRLIGTRVLLGNVEINEYYRHPITKRIELQQYTSDISNPVFEIKDNTLNSANYIYSLVLEVSGSSPKRFYTIDTTAKGEIILSDGAANTYKIQLNEDKTAIIANKDGGKIYPLTINNDSIVIENPEASDPFVPVKLMLKTPYKIENDEITGNKVRVVNRNEIYFTVPILAASGFYDVTVINPDTKKDSKIGNNGFEYFTKPDLKPMITQIDPSEGSVEGGYTITISGKDFETDQTNKAKVYINGIEVKKEDTQVELGGTAIKVKVPKYTGDLRTEMDTDRLTVPVVIVNPADGGTASQEKGFTYVIPSSRPQIMKVIPQKGTAAGGDIVEITGVDFRYYEPYDDKNRNQIYDAGDETFKDLYINNEWDDLLDIVKKDGESDEDFQARVISTLGTTTLTHNQFNRYYASKILPKVYFGENQGKIVEFSRGYLKVIAPPGQSGKADLYILNNDAGISNKLIFTYESSNPKIDQIVPAQGTKLGGDKIEIHGSGFASTEMHIYNNGLIVDGKTPFDIMNRPLIKFADITNRNIPREQENSGRIDQNRTTVKLDGGLTVEYNGVDKKINITIEENNKIFKKEILGYDNSIKFIPVSILSDGATNYTGKELIRLEISDGRLIVERGYSQETELVSSKQVTINTPSYYTIGKVPTVIINPDGGKGQTQYEYKNPDSRPRIINITREGPMEPKLEKIDGIDVKVLRMTYKGGNIVTITGDDFREGATIQISNIATISKDRITYDLQSSPQKMTFEMPNVGKAALNNKHRIVVSNTDGGASYSDGLVPPIYMIFSEGETNPTISKVSPVEGPAGGGTMVKIEGNDFRSTMEDSFPGEKLVVFFGESRVPEQNIQLADYKTLYVTAPKSDTHGKVDIKIENPDGELAVMRDAFTYISQPIIESISPGKIFANDKETEVTITGKMFMPGAKVIIGGKIVNEKDLKSDTGVKGKGINGVDSEGKNIHIAVVDGAEAMSVQVENSTTIKVKFNETLDLTNTHIIVINPDGGISDPYDKFKYEIPVPNKPLVLEGIAGYESTVKLIWSDSAPEILNRADLYEVYGKKVGEKQYTFIGDTRDSEFLVKSLVPNTSYTFMVRAMNRYGSALEFAEVTVRTLSEREDTKLGDKQDEMNKEKEKLAKEGKEEVVGGTLIKTIGIGQIPIAAEPYVIDLSLSKYKKHGKITIAIPVSLVQSLNRKVTITDGVLSFNFLPRDLYTREVGQIGAKDMDDAHVWITLDKLSGQRLEGVNSSIPRTQRRASDVYELAFQLQAGRDIKDIKSMLRSGTLALKHDKSNFPLADSNKIFIGKYVASKDNFQSLGGSEAISVQDPGTYMLLSNR